MAKARKGIEKELLTSMAQAVEFAKGARKGYLVHEFTPDELTEQLRQSGRNVLLAVVMSDDR